MLPITTPISRHDRRVHDLVAVFRLLGVSTQQLPSVLHHAGQAGVSLPLGTSGRLQLTEPFAVVAGRPGRWRTRARLHGRGPRLVPYTRVVVEITPWSPDTSELRLRPVSRSPHAWGIGRLRRYLRLAPLAADAVAAHLLDAAAALVDPASPIEHPTTPATPLAGRTATAGVHPAEDGTPTPATAA